MKVVKEKKIKYCNAYKRIPERDKSVDLIYICHMIEHLDQEETSNILQECKRVLKPGGIVRIVVPDFDRLVDSYNQDHDVNLSE